MSNTTSKVILVTGASSGIGYNTALDLAARGHHVYAAARRVELMDPLKNHGITVIKMDVTDEQSMEDGVNTLLQREGRIDVLVNNAGYGYFGPVENVSMEEARRQLEVNVFGLARLCQLVLPAMRRQRSGRIVNLASVAGRMAFPFGGWYNVSKYSVEALSDALRIEMRPYGIGVSIIEPGPIKTDWGIIASRHLNESTAGTPYEEPGGRFARSMKWGYEGRFFSGPEAVTRVIVSAALSHRPKTRYLVGRYARTLMVVHTLLPTRWWDAIMHLATKAKLA